MGGLTEAQRDLLSSIKEGRRFDNRKTSIMNRTAIALEKLGLIRWSPGRWFGGRWVLSESASAKQGGADDHG
jgi:hypothetical protein